MIMMVISLAGCTGITSHLKREVIKDETIVPGNYTVILYGARHGQDLETVALIDYEGDEFRFVPYAREYDYTMSTYSAEKAVTEAMKLVSWHPSYWRPQLSRIVDKHGKLLGYELRPLYHAILTYGHSDVLDVYYKLKDSNVVIHVSLKRDVEKAMNRDDRNM